MLILLNQKHYLPTFIKSQEVFDLLKEKVLIKSWQLVGDVNILVPQPESIFPIVLMENYLDEPLICVRDKNSSIMFYECLYT